MSVVLNEDRCPACGKYVSHRDGVRMAGGAYHPLCYETFVAQEIAPPEPRECGA